MKDLLIAFAMIAVVLLLTMVSIYLVAPVEGQLQGHIVQHGQVIP